MRALLASLTFLLLVATAADARVPPCRFGPVPGVRVDLRPARSAERYAVVACDAARRARVLRRTRVRHSIGRRITDASRFGDSIVWGELVQRRHSARAVVVEARTDGRVRRRRTVWRARVRGSGASFLRLDVAALRRRAVAWSRRHAVVVARPGRRTVALRPRYGGSLAVEDGRTLGWETPAGEAVFQDVLPVPLRDACPMRSRFTTVSTGDGVRVRSADFTGLSGPATTVVRVCLPAERRDVVVAASGFEIHREVTHVAPHWAVVTATPFEAGQDAGCIGQRIELVDLRSGRIRRAARFDVCDRAPVAGDLQAVTPSGALAWLDRPDPAGSNEVLRATAAGGASVELDRAPAGSISALRAAGERFEWVRAGEPRDAPAP